MLPARQSKNRLKDFKYNGKNPDNMRRMRLEIFVEINKQKKETAAWKRRNIKEESSLLSWDFLSVLEKANQANEEDLLNATKEVSMILFTECASPIDELIESGVVPILVKFLQYANFPDLQAEAAQLFSNMASVGNIYHVQVIVDEGVLSPLVDMLHSAQEKVIEAALWALGNIVSHGFGALAVKYGILEALLQLITKNKNTVILKSIMWMVHSLCRNKHPPLPAHMVEQLLPVLATVITNQDTEVVSDCCWSFWHLMNGTEHRIQRVVNTGIMPLLVVLLKSKELTVTSAALHVLASISSGNEEQTQRMVDGDILLTLKGLMHQHQSTDILKGALCIVANVAAGTEAQIQAVIDAGLIDSLVQIVNEGGYRSKCLALWALKNITAGCSTAQLRLLSSAGVVAALCQLLHHRDTEFAAAVLESFYNLIAIARQANRFGEITLDIQKYGGLEQLQHLKFHPSADIANKATLFIESYI